MGLGHDPEGKTLGILGMGGIGSAVARRAAPFDMNIQYHNRRPVDADQNPTNAKFVSFEELLSTSDVISVHLPLSDTTRHLIGRAEFAMMKEGVVIINTARGKIIDEEALVEALDNGKVFAAGLDVYEHEPDIHEGLIKSDKAVLLPHVGTATFETMVSGLYILCLVFLLYLRLRLTLYYASKEWNSWSSRMSVASSRRVVYSPPCRSTGNGNYDPQGQQVFRAR